MFHVDYETFSERPIDYGEHRYAEDDSTEIMLAGVCHNDGPVYVWDKYFPNSDDSQKALQIIWRMSGSDEVIYAHNANFEMALSKHQWNKAFGNNPPDLKRWRCTMMLCRRGAIPGALAAAGEYLNLPAKKNPDGKKLINFFCKPQTTGKFKGRRITPFDTEAKIKLSGGTYTTAEAWVLFREYCRQDVTSERQVEERLRPLTLTGDTLDAYQFDKDLNHRGIPVNRVALDNAQKIIDAVTARETARCVELCGLEPSQVKFLLEWLRDHGYPHHDLTEASVSAALLDPGDMTKKAVEVLQCRKNTSYTAVKKVTTMRNAVCKDGTVKGCLNWSGAVRTHRWSGAIIQPQNFRKGNVPDIFEAICKGWSADVMDVCFGDPLECCANSIRHFIGFTNGTRIEKKLLDLDYKNIEARVLPWLAGETWLLDAFRQGRDPYCELAALIFDVPKAIPTKAMCQTGDMAGFKECYSLITKDQRFVGKQGVLGAGFQVGWKKFKVMCAKYNRDLDDDLCKLTIETYRKENQQISSMWREMQAAAINAIENPGKSFCVRDKIKFRMAKNLPYKALLMILPSGHALVYPKPEVDRVWVFQEKKYETEEAANKAYRKAVKNGELGEDDRIWNPKRITFWAQDPEKKIWIRTDTYGGKLTENAVQAVAGDFISHGSVLANNAGYKVFLLVHDQALCPLEKGQTKEEFTELFCTLPKWASDFPLAASCDITNYYTKED